MKSIPGANIRIDGKDKGTTGSGKVLTLPVGTHTLELIPFGAGAAVMRTIHVKEGETKTLEYDFVDKGWRRDP